MHTPLQSHLASLPPLCWFLHFLNLSHVPVFGQWAIAYSFPIATITNDYRLSGLKHHNFIFLEFWRPVVQTPFHWAKVKVSGSLAPCRGSEGSFAFFRVQRLPPFLDLWHLPVFKMHHSHLCFHHHMAFASASASSL